MAQYIILASPSSNIKSAAIITAITQLRAGFSTLQAEFLRMSAMKTGDGSVVGDYAEVASVYGVQIGNFADANTAAKALYDETNSALGNSPALIQLMSELA